MRHIEKLWSMSKRRGGDAANSELQRARKHRIDDPRWRVEDPNCQVCQTQIGAHSFGANDSHYSERACDNQCIPDSCLQQKHMSVAAPRAGLICFVTHPQQTVSERDRGVLKSHSGFPMACVLELIMRMLKFVQCLTCPQRKTSDYATDVANARNFEPSSRLEQTWPMMSKPWT